MPPITASLVYLLVPLGIVGMLYWAFAYYQQPEPIPPITKLAALLLVGVILLLWAVLPEGATQLFHPQPEHGITIQWGIK